MIDLPLLFGAVQPPPVTAPAACRRSHRMSDDGPKQPLVPENKAHGRETRQAELLSLIAPREISTGDLHLYTKWSYRILQLTLTQLQAAGLITARIETRSKVTCRFWSTT